MDHVFLAFVRPETLSSLQSQTDDLDEVFQRDLKYTAAHRARLSSLLGSANSTEADESGEPVFMELPLCDNSKRITDVLKKPLKATCYIQE